MLNHTAARLLKYLQDFNGFNRKEIESLELQCYWGCDDTITHFDHIFLSFIVPIQLLSGSKVLWRNPKPSSRHFCRPIRIRFARDITSDLNDEIETITNQIKSLQNFKYAKEGIVVNVNFMMTRNEEDFTISTAAEKTKSTVARYVRVIQDQMILDGYYSEKACNEKMLRKIVKESDPLVEILKVRRDQLALRHYKNKLKYRPCR